MLLVLCQVVVAQQPAEGATQASREGAEQAPSGCRAVQGRYRRCVRCGRCRVAPLRLRRIDLLRMRLVACPAHASQGVAQHRVLVDQPPQHCGLAVLVQPARLRQHSNCRTHLRRC